MRNLTLFLLLLLALPAVTSAQVCGDANASGTVDLSDVSYLFAYLTMNAPLPPGSIDLDAHAGVTLSDNVRMLRYLVGSMSQPDCNLTLNYSFAYAPDDTIFVPHMADVPDGLDTVLLPVTGTLSQNSGGLYLPILHGDALSTSNFKLNHIYAEDFQWAVATSGNVFTTDTTVLCISSGSDLVGRQLYFTLEYVRTAPGLGQVRPEAVNRNALWRTAFERNSDMLIPNVVIADIPLPKDSLVSAPNSFSYTARAGKASLDTFNLSLSATGPAAPYTLSASDEWIRLVNYSGPGTTPATIRVTANAEFLVAGSYSGSITVSSSDPEVVVDPVTLPVNVTVLPPIVFASGDFNCDGVIDLSDLTRMIAYLVMRLPLPPPCY
jgi:hypothetical protein